MPVKRLFILGFIIGLTGSGCSGIRQLTYPDTIVYIDSNQLHSAMHRMAAAMGELDMLLANKPVGADHHNRVVQNLDKIEQISTELSGDNVITNHQSIDEHLDDFRTDVARARLMVSAKPPNYYYAGRLTGSCSACHQFR